MGFSLVLEDLAVSRSELAAHYPMWPGLVRPYRGLNHRPAGAETCTDSVIVRNPRDLNKHGFH